MLDLIYSKNLNSCPRVRVFRRRAIPPVGPWRPSHVLSAVSFVHPEHRTSASVARIIWGLASVLERIKSNLNASTANALRKSTNNGSIDSRHVESKRRSHRRSLKTSSAIPTRFTRLQTIIDSKTWYLSEPGVSLFWRDASIEFCTMSIRRRGTATSPEDRNVWRSGSYGVTRWSRRISAFRIY